MTAKKSKSEQIIKKMEKQEKEALKEPKPNKTEEVTHSPEVEKAIKKVQEKIKQAVSSNMMDSLKAMKAGKPMLHKEIAAITKRDKGNRLRELTAAGLITQGEQEGIRGFVFTITAAGKKLLTETK